MRFFLDTEFIDTGRDIDLLSIGVVSEDGREFYAQNAEAHFERADEWVRNNVLVHFDQCGQGTPMEWPLGGVAMAHGSRRCHQACPWWSRAGIAEGLRYFAEPQPEFWTYYRAYDWVVVSQLYGRMLDVPSGWPLYCRELQQMFDERGVAPDARDPSAAHHALADARWARQQWEKWRVR